ncbi:hypothetical protein Tco_0672869 [Tanacetum coccineum]
MRMGTNWEICTQKYSTTLKKNVEKGSLKPPCQKWLTYNPIASSGEGRKILKKEVKKETHLKKMQDELKKYTEQEQLKGRDGCKNKERTPIYREEREELKRRVMSEPILRPATSTRDLRDLVPHVDTPPDKGLLRIQESGLEGRLST